MTRKNNNIGGGWKTHNVRRRKSKKFWQKWDKKTMIKNIILAAAGLAVLGSIFMLGVFAWATRDLPEPGELLERNIEQATKIYDRTGEHLLYEIHGNENRTLVQLEDIPESLTNATITVEDQQFYKHRGFNPFRIVWSVVYGQIVKGRAAGGSTITQQLVKNAILSDERKISRKIKELILSIEIERRFDKDEILQMYFNEIPYGSTNYGVESAAQSYFGKTVSEITLAESATLAALPKAPSRYLNNPDLLDERRDLILAMMVNEGYLDQESADAAIAEEVVIKDQVSNIDAPHFVLWVKEQLEEKYGERLVEQGGLKVITTLDWDKQQAAETAVSEHVEATGEQYGFSNASLVAIDPKTGQILAMVGSKDYFDDEIDGQVNVALRPRQPGSSFKPIVYTAGFTMGYTPNTVLWDVKTDFPTVTGTYSPNNYDLGERGPVTIRTALQGSLNIPAVKMLYLVGVEQAATFAESLGYTTLADRSRFGLSMVLGGAEVELLEHVNAYATLANEGVHHETSAILRVEEPNGNMLEEWKESSGVKALGANYARMITNVLSDNNARAYVFGTGSKLQLGGRPVAAKTGTTNDYRDGWTIGYTPSLVAGVWGGNNDNTEMAYGAGGSTVAAPIWNAFMRAALADAPVEHFTAPEIPQTGKAMLDGNLPATTVKIDKASGKLATEYTPDTFAEETTFAEYHNLLYYVDRYDPLGDVPGAESSDSMFAPWENAVQNWLTREEEETGITITEGEPPTEYDDLHVPANFPSIQIESPSSGESLADRNIEIKVDGDAPRGIDRVEYYLNGYYLTTGTGTNTTFATIPNTIDRGTYTLRAIAYDDIDNSAIHEISVKITSDPADDTFLIHNPTNNESIDPMGETYSVVLELENPGSYDSISLYMLPYGESLREVVATVENPSSPFITIDWALPAAGDYIVSARARGDSGNLDTAGILVHVTSNVSEPEPEECEGEDCEEEEEPYNPDELNPFNQ